VAAKKERLSQGFAVFNCHVNGAKKRADREFKAQFGQEAFEKYIAPLHEDGIMTVLHEPKDKLDALMRGAWLALCTAYVNEKIRYRLTTEGPVAA
jgi:hypothetical protein